MYAIAHLCEMKSVSAVLRWSCATGSPKLVVEIRGVIETGFITNRGHGHVCVGQHTAGMMDAKKDDEILEVVSRLFAEKSRKRAGFHRNKFGDIRKEYIIGVVVVNVAHNIHQLIRCRVIGTELIFRVRQHSPFFFCLR